jgi:hypothetical protein
LQKYISTNKTLNISGGIVTNTDQANMQGRWVLYNGSGADLNYKDFSNWETLDLG